MNQADRIKLVFTDFSFKAKAPLPAWQEYWGFFLLERSRLT
jgi:hypothetical protein